MTEDAESKKFDWGNFLKWLAIGFTISGFGIAIALLLAILSNKNLY